jgi:cold-inducible RNA-binding protein
MISHGHYPAAWICKSRASLSKLGSYHVEHAASVNSPQEKSPEVKLPKGKGKKIMSMKLYVGNLAFRTSSEELQTLFAQAGTVESVSLIEDRETGRSRGFGFVEMSTKEEGAAAIQQFNGTDLGGRALNVNEAKPREDRGGGGGRNGGSRY